jgi:hypothetical protein
VGVRTTGGSGSSEAAARVARAGLLRLREQLDGTSCSGVKCSCIGTKPSGVDGDPWAPATHTRCSISTLPLAAE